MGGRGRRLRGRRRYFFRQLRGRWRGLWRRAGRPTYSRLPAPADAIAQGAADVTRTDLTRSPQDYRGDVGISARPGERPSFLRPDGGWLESAKAPRKRGAPKRRRRSGNNYRVNAAVGPGDDHLAFPIFVTVI